MKCDDISAEELHEAFLVHASLRAKEVDRDELSKRVADYLEHDAEDPELEAAQKAYREDRFLAPPDVVLQQWGSSRYYELDSEGEPIRHRVCEVWFENGCELPEDGGPELLHFWTVIQTNSDDDSEADALESGLRLRLEASTEGESVRVAHRQYGAVGCLPEALAKRMTQSPMSSRNYLGLVDMTARAAEDSQLGLLVTSALPSVTTESMVTYAAQAFHAEREEC